MFDVFYLGKKPGLFVHERSADSIQHALQQSRTRLCWIVDYLADYTGFDFLWEPPPWQAHQRHVWPSQWQRNSGTMLAPKSGYQDTNYRSDRSLTVLPDPTHWHIPDWIDADSVDTSWHPDHDEAPCIYHFPDQHQRSSGVIYAEFDTDNIKLVDDFVSQAVPRLNHWHIPDWIDPDSIDYSWHPDSLDPPYRYHFDAGRGWGNIVGVEYVVAGAEQKKNLDCLQYRTRSQDSWWHIHDWIDPDSIDRSWVPNPESPPYIYEFPVEWGWNRVGGPQYCVPGADSVKYETAFCSRTRPGSELIVLDQIADGDPVQRWRPNPSDPPYIYVFGNQWWPAEKRASAEYHVPGATERKYMSAPRAGRLPDRNNFQILIDSEFDWSWEPDPGDPPYIYVFGNQWWSAEKMPTVEYHVPGVTERKYMSAPRAELPQRDDAAWLALESCDWDHSWTPDPGDPPYIYVFGNQWWPAETWPTLEYHVPGATERKYVSTLRASLLPDTARWYVPDGIDPDSVDYSWQPDPGSPPYVYEFGTQWQKTGGAVYTMPGATDRKYASAFRCRKVNHDSYWRLPGDLRGVIEDFDWTWHPDTTEQPYIYEFGSQHQKTGGPEYHVPDAIERKYVEQVRVEVKHSRAPAVIIDHMDGNAHAVMENIMTRVPVSRTVRYVSNYLDTLRRIAENAEHEWIWVVSSVCDYSNFDFTWYPEQWQAAMLHVFASDGLKFGDTFFMHVPTFRDRSGRCKLLEWYDVNFLDRSVPRQPLPVVSHCEDSHVEVIKRERSRAPLLLFATEPVPDRVPAVNLWRDEVKTVIPLDPGACCVIVPREARTQIQQQVYDYAYIDKTHRTDNKSEPMDIVFISNGEANADQNWGALLHSKQGSPNRCVRVDGVNGRAAAYHAAAEASETPWFFAVFAKLQVLDNFDWSWQPDRLQQPKHYIFHALNPVNMLEYGHQAMIAYNRGLTLANPGRGLDFTLDDAHEVVPILSGVAHYNVDAWTAWRTAFREVIKLRASLPDVENEWRINRWCANGAGRFADHSVMGAQDALDYYREVNGDFAELRKSYEWSWLASYALLKRNLVPDRQ